MNATVEILHRDDLPRGGFAGLREHRLVMDPRVFGPYAARGTWSGVGGIVYLADARFAPHGDTEMHSHRDIDVISVIVEGRISHQGSLSDGEQLQALDVQVQRAGSEGFTHNEINPDDAENRMIQLWAIPEQTGQPAGYKVYRAQPGATTRVYGGPPDQSETFAGPTVIDVALLKEGETTAIGGEFMAYVMKGEGQVGGTTVKDGDLLRGQDLDFLAKSEVLLVSVHLRE